MPGTLHEGTLSAHAWAWLCVAATVLGVGGVAGFNLLVDPTAQLGTGVVEPVSLGPRDRLAKVALLDRDPMPSLVVLGSSRTKKLDPAWLGADDGVNAAVVGGDLFEARVLAAWLAKRASATGSEFPQLVVGIDVEQFRDSSLQGSGFLELPQVASIARREAAGSSGSLADELDRLERLLLTWQVTKASAAALRAHADGRSTHGGVPVEAVPDDEQFGPTGVPVADDRWLDPATARRLAAATPASIERNVDELRGTYANHGAALDPDAVADLRALVQIAHEAGGPPPLLYVTPAHPALGAALDGEGRAERIAAVRRLLESVARGARAEAVDCIDCIDATDTSWIDATHPSPLGMRQLAARLRDGYAPSATPTERSGDSR